MALVSAEQQLLELMLRNSLDRLRAATADSTSFSPPAGPELPLEPPPPTVGA
ncbi:MAG TPA: hypothetical protein VI670_28210 [Thermoanaerobaculia bacterium]